MKKWENGRLNKEKGIVLLTCLVFLLILLVMLRFILGSAKLEEEKAGIDLDIVNAREAAQAALNYAEYYILRQGKLYCTEADCNVAASANELFSAKESILQTRDRVFTPSAGEKGMSARAIKDIYAKGFYTGTYLKNNASGCEPLWACVKWSDSASSVSRSAAKRGVAKSARTLESLPCDECKGAASISPRYIIERYTTKELADSGLTGLSGSPSGSVVFRITAVGFGKGTGKNLTNVMLQSTYVIPGS